MGVIDIKSTSGAFYDYPRLYHVGNRIPNRRIFKYMDIGTAIKCLNPNADSLRFVQPSGWLDKYESRFYDANYSRILRSSADKVRLTPRLYAACFSTVATSEAAWKTYSYDKTGIGKRCVQFRINLKSFRQEINDLARQMNARAFETVVSYKSDFFISGLHYRRRGNHLLQSYKDYFYGFSLYKYLHLLSLKREAFSYEHECRFFIVPDDQVNMHDAIYPVIHWNRIIEAVTVEQDCDSDYVKELETALDEAGVFVDVERFDLYKKNSKPIKIGDDLQ